jgi:hypothetical protein
MMMGMEISEHVNASEGFVGALGSYSTTLSKKLFLGVDSTLN